MSRFAPCFAPAGAGPAAPGVGGQAAWLDLSGTANPRPYPLPAEDTPASPGAARSLEAAARSFWRAPAAAAMLAAPDATGLIGLLPLLAGPGRVAIADPGGAAGRAFRACGRAVVWDEAGGEAEAGGAEAGGAEAGGAEAGGAEAGGAEAGGAEAGGAAARVLVHPGHDDGRLWTGPVPDAPLLVIDERCGDAMAEASLIGLAARPGCLVLKSLSRFWGHTALRTAFAFGDPALIARLAARAGRVPDPEQAAGARLLGDADWAQATRARLARDAARLDALFPAPLAGGTPLFRLYDTADAAGWQADLARHRIRVRTFLHNPRWLRLGLPGGEGDWERLEEALSDGGIRA
ncbi:aminotransferase class I/II-fold pyridoxal phosphate-dependent enzyme [Paracoccaceae bacterium Fryx2]|nr:aminotransferase class I/II-fold pyridoxal phosphate-dependent enzyme [Paracoccaceae bacterium Fryx2]